MSNPPIGGQISNFKFVIGHLDFEIDWKLVI